MVTTGAEMPILNGTRSSARAGNTASSAVNVSQQSLRPHPFAMAFSLTVIAASSSAVWMPGSSPRLSGLILVDVAHGMDSSVF
jgi:hypothetical protein